MLDLIYSRVRLTCSNISIINFTILLILLFHLLEYTRSWKYYQAWVNKVIGYLSLSVIQYEYAQSYSNNLTRLRAESVLESLNALSPTELYLHPDTQQFILFPPHVSCILYYIALYYYIIVKSLCLAPCLAVSPTLTDWGLGAGK